MSEPTPTIIQQKLAAVKTLLEAISGYSTKVAYHSFPADAAPALPFIVFSEKGSNNLGADNIAYNQNIRIDIEFYSKSRNLAEEGKIEAALTAGGIYFERTVEYIEGEKCFETIYEIEV